MSGGTVPSPEWIAAECARQDAEKAKGTLATQIAAAEQRGREEAERQLDMALRMHKVQYERANREQDRAEKAETALADLRAKVERMVSKWEGDRLNTAIDKEAAAYLLRDLLDGAR